MPRATHRRLAIVGHRGSGARTQAELLAAATGTAHVCAEAVVQAAALEPTRFGQQVAEYVAAERPLPCELMARCVADALRCAEARGRGVVLDGFPMSLAQARAFERIDADGFDLIVQLLVPLAEGRTRLEASGQRGPAIVRAIADEEASLRPLVAALGDTGEVLIVDGLGDRLSVHERLVAALSLDDLAVAG